MLYSHVTSIAEIVTESDRKNTREGFFFFLRSQVYCRLLIDANVCAHIDQASNGIVLCGLGRCRAAPPLDATNTVSAKVMLLATASTATTAAAEVSNQSSSVHFCVIHAFNDVYSTQTKLDIYIYI